MTLPESDAKAGPEASAVDGTSVQVQQFVKELIGIPTQPLRQEFMARQPQYLCPEAVTLLAQAVHEQVRINADAALSIAELALGIAQTIGHRESLGRALRAKANALYVLGKNKEAIEYYQQALEAFEASGNDLELAITLSSSLQPHILLGEYDQALGSADRARAIFTALREERRLARLDINVGNILHRQDRFEEALTYYRRSHRILSSLQDKEATATVLSNLAVCLIALNDFPRALQTYREAREFCQKNGMTVLTAHADYNIAWLYYLRGEYSRAIQMLLANREECRANGDVYQFALNHLDLSEIYLELNLSAEAAETAREGRRLFQANGNGYEETKCLANEAIALSQQGKAFGAIELFQQARKKFVSEKNAVWPWLIDLYQAMVLLEQGRLFEARSLCRSAKSFFSTSTLRGKSVLCNLVLARIALSSGDARSAESECNAALNELQGSEASALHYQAHALMGKIQRALNDSESAWTFLRKAIESRALLRSNLRDEELKIPFLKNKLEMYEDLVELCLERGPGGPALQQALTYIEEAKSRTLSDLLLRSGSSLAPSGDGKSEMVRQILNLREELNWYYHRIDIEQLHAEEKSPERVQKLQQQAGMREAEFLRALREMQAAGEGTPDLPEEISLGGIRSSLPENAAMIEYFTVGDRVIACVIQGESFEIVGMTLASRVVQLLRLLQSENSKFRLGAEYLQKHDASLLATALSHLKDLYQELISPIREKLQATHLVIVPHGPLHYVPFHALHDGASYLIDSFTISYAPSANIFSQCRNNPPQQGSSSLVFGISDENTPEIPAEVQGVASILPSASLFLDSEATLDRLKDCGPTSRFIHIATHGSFRQDNPLFSGIRLGDARLNLYDLYQLKLPAELVTFTGCAAEMGAMASGNELLGLFRGMFYAGADTLLLTHWNVQDQSTAQFMRAFYGKVIGGLKKSAALQQTMIAMRGQYIHPYYWAPFFLVGKID